MRSRRTPIPFPHPDEVGVTRKPKAESRKPSSKGAHMKKGYWIVAYRSISDPSALKAYADLAVPALHASGGRLLTGPGSQVQAHEAGLQQLTIVVEFDSYDIAL